MSQHGRQSDRNAVELPSRLIELRTFACFPVSQHREFYFPPSDESDGFETIFCLECLQILDILIYGRRVCCKAGDWTLCTILGYGLPERETYSMLLFVQISHSYLLRTGKSATCYRYSQALTYRILLSTTNQQRPGCQ